MLKQRYYLVITLSVLYRQNLRLKEDETTGPKAPQPVSGEGGVQMQGGPALSHHHKLNDWGGKRVKGVVVN